jgi:DNA polymerase bacteriophage-type
MKNVITIDIETYSDRDLLEVGLFKYVESPNFEILLFGYTINSDDVVVVDLARGEKIPADVISMLTDDGYIKVAHNSFFEFVCLSKFFSNLDISQWKDTMILSYTLGLPGSLEKLGPILGLKSQKKDTGKALIQYFSVPCKPTKANCYRTRNLPEHDMDRWNLYKEYNSYDVKTEDELFIKLMSYNGAEYSSLWEEWSIDFEINNAGVNIDTEFVENAYKFGEQYSQELTEELIKITGVSNPNSNDQIKKWLSEKVGYKINSIAKGTEIKSDNIIVQKVLSIRNEIQKTSLSKYETMLACQCDDGRARGLLQFYGASTGRWAGRLIQVQNLPKNKMKDLAEARDIVKRGDYEAFKIIWDKPNNVLSELIRTSFIPSPGKKFVVADYSAIEARVIAWLAGETWANDVFKGDGKIYEATASQMFKVNINDVTKELRAKGKIATLALGYQGSVGALTAMGALKMGIQEHELEDIVNRWRKANPHIVKLWSDVQDSCIKAIMNAGETYSLPSNKNVKFKKTGGILFISLPSGRKLKYIKARTDNGRIKYMGVRQVEGSSSKQWCEVDTFGGKVVENIVQAIARDCLMNSIQKLTYLGFEIDFHVHDEVIINAFKELKVETITEIMGEPIEWAPGLYLRAAGYECDFYMKD